jgi:hypothetical protein
MIKKVEETLPKLEKILREIRKLKEGPFQQYTGRAVEENEKLLVYLFDFLEASEEERAEMRKRILGNEANVVVHDELFPEEVEFQGGDSELG